MHETIWPGLASLGILSSFLLPIFFLIALIMSLFIPFWILRIRREIIEINQKITHSHTPLREEIHCPDCAESILKMARVCKHCGYKFIREQEKDNTPEKGRQCSFCGCINEANRVQCVKCEQAL